jgi:hypothetical protein
MNDIRPSLAMNREKVRGDGAVAAGVPPAVEGGVSPPGILPGSWSSCAKSSSLDLAKNFASQKFFLKRRLAVILASAWLSLLVPQAGAAEALTTDPEGYVRHWLMLAPIALRGGSGAEAILKDQIPNEAGLRPKDGDKIQVGGKELTWNKVVASTNFFDFNATLKSLHDQAAGYLVTYIECDADIPEVILAVASNDQGRIYFNGIDIYAVTEARPLMLDADKGRVTLKKGTNVFVFKVINEQNSWQAALRLLDKAGAPLKNVRIKLSP